MFRDELVSKAHLLPTKPKEKNIVVKLTEEVPKEAEISKTTALD